MPFGLVTKAELDQLRADLTADLRKSRALQEEIEYEWAKWFNKFRSLYAMLLKREGKTEEQLEPETKVTEGTPNHLAARRRAMRGF